MQDHPELTPLLTVAGGTMRGASFRLSPRPQVIGRAPTADIVVTDPHLSRRHAEVRLTDAGAVLVDLGSTNGTWLNDRRITGPEQLCDGDVVRLGRTELRFFDPGLATTDPVGLRFAGGGPVRRDHRPTLPLPLAAPATGPTDAWPAGGAPVGSAAGTDGAT
ncbi:FHA domain-containing protein [Micromonospora purpureochromogenes]|uniref:FHA domain-containing protein n=1 Tax=Micromonospora purpureochromogenes TaxID=47872 RepID=A0A1C4W9Q1_9ACTN|nr:FHA domain-containing protein [Micromonospora purpureochromogenes]SCE92957.1 FHA domain-containing protein [Micromonospora purpureochromogenes]